MNWLRNRDEKEPSVHKKLLGGIVQCRQWRQFSPSFSPHDQVPHAEMVSGGQPRYTIWSNNNWRPHMAEGMIIWYLHCPNDSDATNCLGILDLNRLK